jgi:hypothetical protein
MRNPTSMVFVMDVGFLSFVKRRRTGYFSFVRALIFAGLISK